MLSPITASNVRVEERESRERPRQRPQKRRKKATENPVHEEHRGDKIDLTA